MAYRVRLYYNFLERSLEFDLARIAVPVPMRTSGPLFSPNAHHSISCHLPRKEWRSLVYPRGHYSESKDPVCDPTALLLCTGRNVGVPLHM